MDTIITPLQKLALYRGILSSVWYVIINIYVPMQYDGYSLSALTVSELSAVGAPTRQLWILLVIPYPLLFAFFGWGIRKTAGKKSNLRLIGGLIIAYSIFNIYWPPMHMRGSEPTLTDTLHIVWAMVTVLLMIILMGLGAFVFGTGFRIYTFLSITLHVVFGILTSLEAPNIPTNGSTPWIGVWERINIAVFMLWIAVLSIIVLTQISNRKKLSP